MKKSLDPYYKIYFLSVSAMLLILFAVMRGYGMLGSPMLRPLLPISFMLMTVIPFILLKKESRSVIGLKKGNSNKNYLIWIVSGASAALLCFGLGVLMFGQSSNNWFVTIQNFYIGNGAFDKSAPVWKSFLIFTIPALIFSPIGEELFFRGFLQEALKLNFSERFSTIIECSCFGLIHLFHHGLVNVSGKIIFVPLSGSIWVILMAAVAFMLLQIRKLSHSLYPAIVCHASFNLMMNWIIFYWMDIETP